METILKNKSEEDNKSGSIIPNILEESLDDIIFRYKTSGLLKKNDEITSISESTKKSQDEMENQFSDPSEIDNNNNNMKSLLLCDSKSKNQKFSLCIKKKEMGTVTRIIKTTSNNKRKSYFINDNEKKKHKRNKTHLRIMLDEKNGRIYDIPLKYIARTKQSSYLLNTCKEGDIGKICAYYRGEEEKGCRNGCSCTLIHLDPKCYHAIRSDLI